MANEFKVKKGLVVDGTGTVLDIQGTQGQLFSVTDSLTGDLFSVSDISGIPIFNVNSSGLTTTDGTLSVTGNSTFGGVVGLTSGTSGTTSKLLFKTTDNADGSAFIQKEAYWLRLSAHQNEGFKFTDTTNSTILLQLNGGAQTGGNGINSATFLGSITGTTLTGTSLDINGAADISTGSMTTAASHFQLNTPSGYIQIGAMNTSHAHIYSDRPTFYFNKSILILGNTVLTTASTGITTSQITNLSGTNTGDQTLSGLGGALDSAVVHKSGTESINGAKTFSNTANHYSGHLYFDPYDAAGNHYPHFNDGSDAGGTTVNWRQYYGSSYKTHQWVSDASGNMQFTYRGIIKATSDGIFGGNIELASDKVVLFKANSTWSALLKVGGNGWAGNSTTASMVTTNGNLHLDAATGQATYLNYYAGTGGIKFCDGANNITASLTSAGVMSWNAGNSNNANTAYTHSQAAHAPSNANYITNNNQLTNGSGFQNNTPVTNFTVYGDTDKYYPVILTPPYSSKMTHMQIYRGYSETGPNDWNTSTHKGGVTIDFAFRFGGWGGYPNMYEVSSYGEIYSRIFGGMAWTAHTMKMVVYLRGGGSGGATYHVCADQLPGVQVCSLTSDSNYVDNTNNGKWYSYDNSNNAYDVFVYTRTQTQADTGIQNEVYARMAVRKNLSLNVVGTPSYTLPYINTTQTQTAAGNKTFTGTNFTVGSGGTSSLYCGNEGSGKFTRFHLNNTDTYWDMACGDVIWRQGSAGGSHRFEHDMTNGKFLASGDIVAFGSPSDKRLKENIKPVESALDKVMKLQGVTFDWKEKGITNLKHDIGLSLIHI